ncbi:hypothetical protein GZL_00315 [Streptomyces sp. 769]|nr:hypothetical protein GZL_00315 [Streptomyces sp. 769]
MTGAASGIGRHCAEALAARGTRVAALDDGAPDVWHPPCSAPCWNAS